ncbi:SanA/YdcF family protein [Rhodococcoides corynebacterioides]|uniref:YdcF family protein n=1 Tax=Rhodococcoides corynebacterioides TaxID=53972 RepID=A0ABS7P3W2_9NOCA|nr:ElyC/SanA/YdcF family protein [Rhodococcus corynebacterioides]MBY6366731.1 YdcF family protein [Rhodococcus corynebacterioides]MBY6409318.1 YdcF family protein [Rhodococcus corynebacterioides]
MTRRSGRGGVRTVRAAAMLTAAAVLGSIVASSAWIELTARGRVHGVEEAPSAPVALVLGARVENGAPARYLAARTSAAARLVELGRVEVLLLSGNGSGDSGDEIAAMTDDLIARGVDPARLVADPFGLNTRDSCLRAARTYGVTRALVVSQGMHTARALAQCRDAGIDADGVDAPVEVSRWAAIRQCGRELLARPKAAATRLVDTPPTVDSPPTDDVQRAVAAVSR